MSAINPIATGIGWIVMVGGGIFFVVRGLPLGPGLPGVRHFTFYDVGVVRLDTRNVHVADLCSRIRAAGWTIRGTGRYRWGISKPGWMTRAAFLARQGKD